MMGERVEVTIAQMNGETDPPPIAITVKQGSRTVLRVELTPTDFALCLTGRLVFGEVTRNAALVSAFDIQAEAFRAFDRWRNEHDPLDKMDVLEAAAAYSLWASTNSIAPYLDSAPQLRGWDD